MFFGNNQLTVDAKGRIAVPTRHREPLIKDYGPSLVITPDAFEQSVVNDKVAIHCLKVYPLKVWQTMAATWLRENEPPYVYMVANAQDSEMDAQGRVLLATTLREKVGYEKRLMMVGRIDHFELWREDFWEESQSRQLQETREMASDKFKSLQNNLTSSTRSAGELRAI